jgi:L-lysine 6-transaminase
MRRGTFSSGVSLKCTRTKSAARATASGSTPPPPPLVDTGRSGAARLASRINSTWGGNLTDMVRSQKYFEIIQEENLVEHAAKMGEYFEKKMDELEKEFPELISNVRARGLFAAFTLPNPEIRDQVFQKAYENRVIVLKSGVDSIRFRPPLNIQPNEIDQGFEILRQVMKTL